MSARNPPDRTKNPNAIHPLRGRSAVIVLRCGIAGTTSPGPCVLAGGECVRLKSAHVRRDFGIATLLIAGTAPRMVTLGRTWPHLAALGRSWSHLAALGVSGYKQRRMFIHTVYFSTGPDFSSSDATSSSDSERVDVLIAACRELARVPGVVHLWSGRPAATDRPVIDREYAVALCIAFNDQAGHDAYQAHPVHLAFVERCQNLWKQVRIFDFDEAVDRSSHGIA